VNFSLNHRNRSLPGLQSLVDVPDSHSVAIVCSHNGIPLPKAWKVRSLRRKPAGKYRASRSIQESCGRLYPKPYRIPVNWTSHRSAKTVHYKLTHPGSSSTITSRTQLNVSICSRISSASAALSVMNSIATPEMTILPAA
jgi:hypothetical protein